MLMLKPELREEKMTVKLMAKTAESLPDLSSPAAHASERLGLPRSFLWKNDAERARLLENAAARQASVAAE